MQVALALTDLDFSTPDEPRITDAKLAEALGYSRVRKLRELIESHKNSLAQLDVVESEGAKTHGGTRPTAGRVYRLSRKQALFICTKSETPLATAVTIAIVEVFDAAMTGRQAPARTVAISDRRTSNRIRHAKLRLAEAATALDDHGVDVTRINLGTAVGFWRSLNG